MFFCSFKLQPASKSSAFAPKATCSKAGASASVTVPKEDKAEGQRRQAEQIREDLAQQHLTDNEKDKHQPTANKLSKE